MNQADKKVLITGGGGLIGTATRRAFETAGWQVSTLDLRTHDLAGQHVQYITDLTTDAHLESIMQGFAGIVHLAAVSRVCEAQQQPAKCSLVNRYGTQRVLAAAAGCRWLIFGSSREVYGEQTLFPVCESAELCPINHYGRIKVEGEQLVATQCRAHGMLHSVLRFSNVYGHPHDHPSRLINSFIRRALAGQALEIHGGKQVFDFTYVEDTAQAIVAAAEQLQDGSIPLPPLHVLTGKPTGIHELALMVLAIVNDTDHKTPPSPRSTDIRFTAGRDYDVNQFYGDPALLQKTLKFACQTSLRDGLRRTVQKYRKALASPRTSGDQYSMPSQPAIPMFKSQ